MKALVVGGAGYIGGATADLLAQAGHQVSIVDNLSTGQAQRVNNFDFYQLDILDKDALEKKIGQIKPDVVLHFAAKIRVDESVKIPGEYFNNNITGSINLLESMTKLGIKNIIFSSSAAVYGNTKTSVSLKESDKCQPSNPYGLSKLVVEQLLNSYQITSAINWTAFRYFNAAGVYKNIAMDYPFTSHLIPSIAKSITKQSEFHVYGNDYATPDGTCIRDFVHVFDIAKAHVMAAEKMFQNLGQTNEIYNLGSGQGYSVLEVIKAFEKAAKQKINYSFQPKRPGDPAALIADTAKVKKSLGWQPKYKLEDMVASHWNWHENNADKKQTV